MTHTQRGKRKKKVIMATEGSIGEESAFHACHPGSRVYIKVGVIRNKETKRDEKRARLTSEAPPAETTVMVAPLEKLNPR